jgi:hypothetical protein
MNRKYEATGPMSGHHANPPAPFNPLYDAGAKDRSARVTASMSADAFYDTHSREECKAEWARRYDADLAATGIQQPREPMAFKVNDGKLSFDLQGSILEVSENSAVGSNKTWYYDIESWMVSSHGKKGDTPDRPMTEGGIAWVQTYYLPYVDVSAAVNGPKI